MSTVLPRPFDGGGVDLFASALTVPYAAGMESGTVPLANGTFAVTTPRRAPVLLVRLRRNLADEAVVVRAKAGGTDLAPVVLAPFSAEGTLLPLFRPEVPEDGEGSGPFSVAATVELVTGEQRLLAHPEPTAVLDGDAAAALVEGVVLEGRFARLLYLGTLEKQRIVRQAREISAAAHLDLAHSGALDQRGLGLGVPRRKDRPESDAEYRARLAIYEQWRLATPAGLRRSLDTLLPRAGITAPVRLVEQTNDLAVSLKLVAVGPDGTLQRGIFQTLLCEVFFVDLDTETSRNIPEPRRAGLEALRTDLATSLVRTAGDPRTRFMAPLLARSLGRLLALLRQLGQDDAVELLRAFDAVGGSRYELGLGIDLARFTAAQLDALVAAAAATPVAGTTPRPSAEDPVGRWLYDACGFRTVQAVDATTVHLSTLPTLGSWIDGPNELPVSGTGTYLARMPSPAGTGRHTRLQELIDALAEGLRTTVLSPSDLQSELDTDRVVTNPPPVPDALAPLVASGILAADCKALATQLVDTADLGTIAGLVVADATVDSVAAIVSTLQDSGFSSTRAIWDGSRLVVLASVAALPGGSPGSGEPPAASYYWYAAQIPQPVPGAAPPVQLDQRRGGRATVRTGRMGVSLLTCVSYVRRGLADPFEVRVEIDDPEVVLTLDQYGYLMNLLEATYPIGIEVNTFDVRRHHVDADGDGKAEWLTSRASRTYHQFRHRRPFGSGRGRDQRPGEAP